MSDSRSVDPGPSHMPRGQKAPKDAVKSDSSEKAPSISNPLRPTIYRLVFHDQERRKALDQGSEGVAKDELSEIVSDLKVVVGEAIKAIRRSKVNPEDRSVRIQEKLPDLLAVKAVASLPRGTTALLFNAPARDIEQVLADFAIYGGPRAGARDEAIAALQNLLRKLSEIELNADHAFLSKLLPKLVPISLFIGIYAGSGSISGLSVGDKVTDEAVKAVVAALVVVAATNALKALDARRHSLSTHKAHDQLVRDLAEYDKITKAYALDKEDTRRAICKMRLIIDVSLVQRATYDENWPKKHDYWQALDTLQDWLEGRRFRGHEKLFAQQLDASKPPRKKLLRFLLPV